jgi:ligand-binding SRPBCC domain-containing protein
VASVGERVVAIESVLSSPAHEVWAVVSTMAGVNDELSPLLVMTSPKEAQLLDLGAAPTGVKLFRSWLLLFGVLPVDYDDLFLASVTPGVGFVETSTLASARTWRHERTIDPLTDAACRIVDRVTFEPRVPLLGGVLEAIVRQVFAHRHRRLQRRFGSSARPPR